MTDGTIAGLTAKVFGKRVYSDADGDGVDDDADECPSVTSADATVAD